MKLQTVSTTQAGVKTEPYPWVQEQIVWFDVSVNEAQLVNGINGQNGLCYIKLSSFFTQGVFLHQQGHHVSCSTASVNMTRCLIFCRYKSKYLQAPPSGLCLWKNKYVHWTFWPHHNYMVGYADSLMHEGQQLTYSRTWLKLICTHFYGITVYKNITYIP